MDAHATEVPATGGPGPQNASEQRRSAWPAFATALLVALLCLRIPQTSLTTGLDDSWGGVLIFAHEHGLQFGRDIAFTYGPLGIFSVSAFSPAMAWPRMIFEVLLSCGVAAGLCLLAWRMTLRWRVALLATFVLVSAPIHWGGDDLLVELGLLFWGLLCWLESGRRLKIFAACLVSLAAVCALIKFTLLIIASMTIAVLVGDLILRGRRKLAVTVAAGFVLAFLLGWTCAGQKLPGLVPFLHNSLAISSGYNQAMGFEDFGWGGGLLVVLAALAAVATRVMATPLPDAEYPRLRRGVLLAWLTGLLFLEWKYGFVRADWDHTACFLGFVPVAALAAAALPAQVGPAKWWREAFAPACLVLALILVQSAAPNFFLKVCERTPDRVYRNIASLLRPFAYEQEKSDTYRKEQAGSQLPKSRGLIGAGTADVFGQPQMFAVFNGLNYQPRPVFQSYSAYTRQLMELNERFYSSSNSPEFVLFNLTPIDQRFPPLEDALVLRDLLFNYEPAAEEGDFLVLRRRQTAPPRMTLIGEGDVSAGDAIRPGKYGDGTLWMEIRLQPTLPGVLRQTFYKPPEVRLGVWSAGETSPGRGYHAPACMLAAGFVASPLVLANSDVLHFHDVKTVVRPEAYSVELPNGRSFWQDKIHFRIYRIENRPEG
jgi:hypothetical protein